MTLEEEIELLDGCRGLVAFAFVIPEIKEGWRTLRRLRET